MLNLAVVDDERENRELLSGFINRYAQENNLSLAVTAFADGAQIAEPYQGGFDIIFLDIEMPMLGGMTAAERIRAADPDVVLVFVTNLAQYAIRGYEVDAIGFLVKPVTLPGLTVKLNKAFKRVEYRQSKICLKTKDNILFLEKNEIYYAEGSNHHVIYHTAQGEFPVRSSLQEAEEQLGAEFSRSSHSYIVNLGFVTMVGKNDVTVHGEAIPLSRAMRRDFLNAVNRYYGVR